MIAWKENSPGEIQSPFAGSSFPCTHHKALQTPWPQHTQASHNPLRMCLPSCQMPQVAVPAYQTQDSETFPALLTGSQRRTSPCQLRSLRARPCRQYFVLRDQSLCSFGTSESGWWREDSAAKERHPKFKLVAQSNHHQSLAISGERIVVRRHGQVCFVA